MLRDGRAMGAIGSVPPARLPSRAASLPDERVLWPDIARGIGIILVVIGHSLGGMIASGQIAAGSILDLTMAGIYTFHMPLFFVLSGIFVPARLAKDPDAFARVAVSRILYPYFVWGVIQLAAIAMLGKVVNAPQEPSAYLFLSMLWAPPSHYWFLYALFVFQIAALLFDRFANATVMVWVALGVRFIPAVLELPDIVAAMAQFWIFHAVAVRFSHLIRGAGDTDPDGAHREGNRARPAFLAALWLGAVVASLHGGGYRDLSNLPAAILGVVLVLQVARMPGLPGSGLLAAIGRRSMPIFLMHVLIVAGIRIVFTSVLGITDPYGILAVAVTAGVLVPILVFDWADRRKLASLLALR